VREAAIELVNRAMERGTLDNVSAIVVVLPRD
jgi:serine/threonine protein phosphatase PrpC